MKEGLKPCPLDEARKVLWYCAQFTDNTHWAKHYRKALTDICNELDRRTPPESDNAEVYLEAYKDLLQKAEELNETLLKKLKTSSQKELLSCAGCKNFEVDNISDTCAECARFVHPDYYTRKPEGSKKE